MSEIKRFTLDANIDGMDQMREFVLASDYDSRVHDLETMCDPAGLTAENALLRDQTRMLDAMIGRLKTEAQDAMDTLVAVLNAIGYTEEFAAAHPELKVSEGVKLFLATPGDAEHDELKCDSCGAETPDPWHTSDATRKHLHECDACHPAPTQGADARPANMLGPDEDGLPIARYSYQTGVGMVEHRNGTYVRYGEVELRLRSFKGPADAPSDAIGASK